MAGNSDGKNYSNRLRGHGGLEKPLKDSYVYLEAGIEAEGKGYEA